MPNAEARMTKEARMSKSELAIISLAGYRHEDLFGRISSFGIRHSFVIRASAFGIGQ